MTGCDRRSDDRGQQNRLKITKFKSFNTKITMGFIRILFGTILISIFSLPQVRGVKPIFGKYLDNRVHALLRIIAMSQDSYKMANPVSIIEADRRIDDTILKMKKYLIDDALSHYSRVGQPQRKLFWLVWPAFHQPKKTQTRVDGNFHGGIKENSFQFSGHFVGSYNADFNMRRKRHRKRNKKKFGCHKKNEIVQNSRKHEENDELP